MNNRFFVSFQVVPKSVPRAKGKADRIMKRSSHITLVLDEKWGEAEGKAEEAQDILNFTVKRACLPVLKLLNSALANAKDIAQKDGSTLFISKITVDEGPTLKRILPRAKGKADRMMKRSSHITLVLDEKWSEAEMIEKGKKNKKVLNKKDKSVVTDGKNK